MSLSVFHDRDLDCLTLHVLEKFDFSVHRDFHEACLVGQPRRRYVVDLGGVSVMDSSALGMLLLLHEHAGGPHAEIRIINADAALRGTLRVAGFDKMFVLH